MSLTFDAEKHEYRWQGVAVPSVTQALKPLTDYSAIPLDKLEIARQKGVAVHKMIELDCAGDLDEDALPEWMRPVLVQWRKFVSDSGFVMLLSEHRVYHPDFRYAGTLDLFGMIKKDHALIDVKRSFLAGGVIGYQTAAYLHALAEQADMVPKTAKRYALRLNETCPYRLEPFQNSGDFQQFLVALSFHNLKEKHK